MLKTLYKCCKSNDIPIDEGYIELLNTLIDKHVIDVSHITSCEDRETHLNSLCVFFIYQMISQFTFDGIGYANKNNVDLTERMKYISDKLIGGSIKIEVCNKKHFKFDGYRDLYIGTGFLSFRGMARSLYIVDEYEDFSEEERQGIRDYVLPTVSCARVSDDFNHGMINIHRVYE